MWVGGGWWWWVVGGMRANTETSRSSARARAATTMSISSLGTICPGDWHYTILHLGGLEWWDKPRTGRTGRHCGTWYPFVPVGTMEVFLVLYYFSGWKFTVGLLSFLGTTTILWHQVVGVPNGTFSMTPITSSLFSRTLTSGEGLVREIEQRKVWVHHACISSVEVRAFSREASQQLKAEDAQ